MLKSKVKPKWHKTKRQQGVQYMRSLTIYTCLYNYNYMKVLNKFMFLKTRHQLNKFILSKTCHHSPNLWLCPVTFCPVTFCPFTDHRHALVLSNKGNSILSLFNSHYRNNRNTELQQKTTPPTQLIEIIKLADADNYIQNRNKNIYNYWQVSLFLTGICTWTYDLI